MDNDDLPTGRILSRRQAVTLLGVAGYAVWSGVRARAAGGQERATPSCVVRPEQTEGPYFVDEMLNRSDIRSDPTDGTIKPGAPLALTIAVSRLNGTTCEPARGVQVDLWQCDHVGVYSDVRDPRFDSTGKKFLRGFQVTGEQGLARFATIYPGWYQGRTVHLHFKLRSPAGGTRAHEFTSQLYFDDALTDRVFAAAPYSERGPRSTRNDRDGIYRRGGSQLMLDVTPAAGGYAGTFHVAMQGV